MPFCFSRLSAVVLLACVLPLLISSPPSSAQHAATSSRESPHHGASRGTDRPVLHRVVWDQYRQGRRGIHLRSVRLDGTGVRRVYDSRRGFTTDLTLDRAGRRVAFSPCCSAQEPVLVVARVRGGATLAPLEAHPRIDSVGGIGWSPDGRRLAFEGTTGTYPNRVTYLWTIRPNGTGLERILNLGSVRDNLFINDSLSWTRAGILYSDGRNLRSAKAGESELVLRRVRSVRISGDGHHIITARWRNQTRSIWISAPNGTDKRRLFVEGDPVHVPTFYDVTPNYDGSALLAYRMSGGDDGFDAIVTWPTNADPSTSTVVESIGYAPTATWN